LVIGADGLGSGSDGNITPVRRTQHRLNLLKRKGRVLDDRKFYTDHTTKRIAGRRRGSSHRIILPLTERRSKYLHRTVVDLAERQIFDANLWQLQKLVAAKLEALPSPVNPA